VKRLAELEARRRELLARCETERADLAWRLGQLGPKRWVQAVAGGAATGAVGALRSQRRHPLAWVVAVAALLLLRRPRDALFLLGRARGAITWVARAAEMLALVGAFRRRKR
jgi:hypothetical protein